MSFRNGVWVDPDQAELDRIRDSIFYPDESQPASPQVPDNFQEVLSDVVDSTVESTKIFINNKVYSQTKKLKNLFGKKVDIVLPVYNAIHLTEECIRKVYERTDWPFHLTVIDDASNKKANDILQSLQKEFGFDLLVNKKNHGFAASVNKAVKHGSNPYIVLLNSDVLVTDGWLTKMLLAMEDDSRNQIVNPVTNNTAQINVNMYPGYSYIAMNKAFETYSERRYPEIMPTGFCYMVKRELFKKLGYLPNSFTNYGEETYNWVTTVTHTEDLTYPHYRAVLADDTYVYHQRSVSFGGLGEDENMKLRKKASAKFHRLCPQFPAISAAIDCSKELEVLRSPLSAGHLNSLTTPRYRICWLVHSVEMCGGMKYIADIINEINERGGDARVALIKRKQDMAINPIAELRTAPIVFENYQDAIDNFKTEVFNKGIVVASTVELADTVNKICDNEDLKPLLHVQSYEPDLIEGDDLKDKVKGYFKLIPNVISSSGWVAEQLQSDGIKVFDSIVPGVDSKIFYPRNRAGGDDRPTVMISVRRSYAFKGYERAVQLIKYIHHIAESKNFDVRILTYGVEDIPEAQEAICLGPLSQVRLAETLGKEVDVFIDPSNIHSYGLPALEALVSGCAVVSWDNKGIYEYVESGKNGAVFPAEAPASEVALKIVKLLAAPVERQKYAANFGQTAKEHCRTTSIDKFIKSIEKHFQIVDFKKILVMTPHLRKHGGPTTIVDIANGLKEYGHDVVIGTTYSDIEYDVGKCTDIPVKMFDLGNLNMSQQSNIIEDRIPEVDVIISNADNPINHILVSSKKANQKIMLKLSHNERFKALEEQGMQLPWDAVLTSSDWLKEVCHTVTKGWNYKPFPEDKVHRIGWSHYGHQIMNCPPYRKDFSAEKTVVITTLIHAHPSKGTVDALKVLDAIYKLHGNKVQFLGIGEVHPKQLDIKLPNYVYQYAPTREKMAALLAKTDIWLGTSHSEGLGRMALEAMSASVVPVLTDTGAEFARHGENAYIAPVGDLKQLANLVSYLVTNPEARRAIAGNAYATASEASNKRSEIIEKINKVMSNV